MKFYKLAKLRFNLKRCKLRALIANDISKIGVFIFCLLCSCARPTYLNAPTGESNKSGNNGSNSNYQNMNCELRWSQSQLCLAWSWEIEPSGNDFGSFIIKIYRENIFDKTPILIDSSSEVEVVLWMPSMGHGSTPTVVSRIDVGTYRVSQVSFIMPGAWEVKFIKKYSSNEIEEVKVDIFRNE